MSGYLSHVQAEAHAADLGEQARRGRSGHAVRTGRPPRFRNAMARLMLGLAMRHDHSLRPTASRPSASAPCT